MVGIASRSSSSISSGAVAGIVVGCAVILASTALGVLYFCLRARWKPLSTKSIMDDPLTSPTAVPLVAATTPASDRFPFTPQPSPGVQGSFPVTNALLPTLVPSFPNQPVSEVQGDPLPAVSQAQGAIAPSSSVPQAQEAPLLNVASPQTQQTLPPAYFRSTGVASMSVSRTPRP
jgi:hypothetical protein